MKTNRKEGIRSERSLANEARGWESLDSAQDAPGGENPEDTAIRQGRISLLWGLITITTKSQRPVLIGTLDGESIEEIANRLNISEGAARTRLYAGRNKIRRELRILGISFDI